MKNLIARWFNRGLAAAAVLLLSSANAGILSAGSSSYHAPIVKLRHGTSTNWSGYAAYNGSFNSVSASWVQPTLNCGSGGYSSYWVGLDGYNSSTVEQLGTEGDCSNGVASFYAWFEMYPHPGYYINTITVHPNDHMTASVTYRAPGSFTLTLTDTTTSKSFSTTQKMNQAKRTSAEVVLEAPWNGGVLPLDNFGTAYFTNSLANNSPLGSLSPLDPITMLNPAGMKATPSVFDTTKKNFSVTWLAN